MKRAALTTFALCVAALAAVPAMVPVAAPQLAKAKVADKVALKAWTMPMTEVRLLDGPFKAAMLRDQQFLLSIDPDRLLHMFRVTAGLPSTAQPYGGWESPTTELRGHSMGHYLSALALMYASTGDVRFKDRGNLMVSELAKVQAAMPAKGFHPGYLSAFPEDFFDRLEARTAVWAPYYTIHKIMAGLLDMYELADNQQALDVVTKQADWVTWRIGRLSDEQMQATLQTEQGGMTEVLANLYAATGNEPYLADARKFEHHAIIDPLAQGIDPLSNSATGRGVHGNTQFPKIIGAAREYELTGEQRYCDIANFFWSRVVHDRSYVTGGNTDGEAFFPPEQFSKHLGPSTAETCNTYNMLKLSRHIFEWNPSADVMDYYERALYNHILGSQDPETGMMIYYCPLRPGAFKEFSTPDDSFWCCVGTGMENHSKDPDTIYFQDASSLYVNLFIASDLDWKEKAVKVRQETGYPEQDSTKLTFTAATPTRFTLRLRYPKWAQSGITLTVNGMRQAVTSQPGSYVAIDRQWKTGDVVQVRLPMTLHTEAMPDDPSILAVMYGPVVLAGDLGQEGLDGVKRYGPNSPPVNRVPPVEVPEFVGDAATLLSKIQPVAGQPLTFKTVGLARPHDVTLVPFYKMFADRYTVYWKMTSAADYDAANAERDRTAARRASFAERTVDVVDISSADSERVHNMRSQGATEVFFDGRRGHDAGIGRGRGAGAAGAPPPAPGWISYDLKVSPGQPLSLVCLYRGSQGGRPRTFDILVDGRKLVTETLEYHPTEFLDREYQLPDDLVRGKDHVTVTFQSQPTTTAGTLFEVRVVRR